MAKIDVQPGSGFADSFMTLNVADSSKTLQERIRIDVDGNVLIPADSKKLILGEGSDMSIFYDGTDAKIVTDDVAASDLIIDCGTEKTVELAEIVWDDQQVALGAVGFGSSAPTWEAYKGGEVLAFANSQNNEITFIIQYSHRVKVGSATEFHLHTIEPNGNTGNVRWQLTVSYASLSGTFPTESTTTITQTVGAQDVHTYAEITDTFVSSAGISGIAICSLTRLGSDAADTLNGDIYLAALDSHFQINTVGS